ncbi:TPA: transcriptional regulator [Bacillus paranthracis]
MVKVNEQKLERVKMVNELIKFIADVDMACTEKSSAMFFSNESRKGTQNHYASFVLEGRNIYYIDDYTEEKVSFHPASKHRGFSPGGTMWGLVSDFKEWIKTGEASNGIHGYGGLYALNWGSRIPLLVRDMIINKAKEMGYLRADATEFSTYVIGYVGDKYEHVIQWHLEEAKRFIGCVQPVESLAEVMMDRNISLMDLETVTGIPVKDLLKILSAETRITEEVAEKLEIALAIKKGFWINLENKFQKSALTK